MMPHKEEIDVILTHSASTKEDSDITLQAFRVLLGCFSGPSSAGKQTCGPRSVDEDLLKLIPSKHTV